MQVFITTIDTLYDAVLAYSLRVVRAYVYADASLDSEINHLENEHEVMELPAPQRHKEIEAPKFVVAQDQAVSPLAARGVVMYVGEASVPVYKNPTIEFDGQVGTISFGAMVMAGEAKGRFYYITQGLLEGWVLRDDLADKAATVYPVFEQDKENLIDDSNTARVRAIIKDEFGLGRSEFSLQAGEYVLYRLARRGLSISWPSARPRVPGMWHEILKGKSGIRIHIAPKVGTIMEYLLDGEMGHVAYVEAVFPDETISISEVNNPDSGIYKEKEYTKDEWKEFRPVFIEVQ
jgi:hypothetical protein